MIRKLEEYAALGPTDATSVAAAPGEETLGIVSGDGAASMARGEGELADKPAEEQKPPENPAETTESPHTINDRG
jgi:hypothetical protein